MPKQANWLPARKSLAADEELQAGEKRLTGGLFTIKALPDGAGYEIAGYASVYNVVDGDGETMAPGAFDPYLPAYLSNPILLFDHGLDPDLAYKPVGTVTEAHSDSTGLFITAQVYPSPLPAIQAVYEQVQKGLLRAFSVGGFKQMAGRVMKRFDLREISLVAMPSNQLALRTKAQRPDPDPEPSTKRGAVLSADNLTDVGSMQEMAGNIKDLATGVLQRHHQSGGSAAEGNTEMKGLLPVDTTAPVVNTPAPDPTPAPAPQPTPNPPTTPAPSPSPQPQQFSEEVLTEAKKRLEAQAEQKAAKEREILAAAAFLESEAMRPTSKAVNLGYGQPEQNGYNFPNVNYNRPRQRFSFGEAYIRMAQGEDYIWEGKSLRKAQAQAPASTKAITQGTAGAVGYFVPEDWMDTIVPFIQFQSILPHLGVTEIPWGDGYDTIHWPVQTGTLTAYMVGEAAAITTSDLASSEVIFTEHYAAAAELASRQVMRNAPALDALIRYSLLTRIMLKLDQQAFEGIGSGGEIQGILGTAGIGTYACTVTGVATNGGTPTYDDIFNLIYQVEQYGVQVDMLVMNPRTVLTFSKIKDTTGNYIRNTAFGYNAPVPMQVSIDEKASVAPVGYLCGKPVWTTDQISITRTVGSSSDCSIVYAMDKESFAYAMKGGILIESSTEAGTNTFLQHQMLLKGILTCDSHVLRGKGIATLTGVRP